MKCGPSVRSGVRRKGETGPSGNASSGGSDGAREVYFELYAVGESMKVSAVDSATGTEVSIVGPAKLPQAELERVALNKLNYVMKQRLLDDDPLDGGGKATRGGKGGVG